MKLFKQILIVTASVFVLGEIFYRLTGRAEVYLEKIGQPYQSGYGTVSNTWYHIRKPNHIDTPENNDFNYPYSTNDLGIREKPVHQTKSDSVIRILVTGDSFAEGVGAPYDSTWPRLLEAELNRKSLHVEIINAGVAGSDIFFDYVRYRDTLNKLKPDLIIASMNTSDYVDYGFRGGMERFYADGTTHYKPAPWYETIYRHSHFLRAVMNTVNGYTFAGLFISNRDYPDYCKNVTPVFEQAIAKFGQDAANHNAKFVVVFHSIPTEIEYSDYPINQCNLSQFDTIVNSLTWRNIPGINITSALYKKLSPLPKQKFTYPNDKHYTPYGYSVMAQLIADSLVARQIIRLEN